jgi:hypothetical protein
MQARPRAIGGRAPLQPLQLAPLQRTTTVDLQHAADNNGTCNGQHATDNRQRTPRRRQRQRCNRQQTTCNGQLPTDNMQRTRRNMQHCRGTQNVATAHMQRCNRPRTTDHRKHAILRPTADNVQHARDNGQQTQHAPHNMQHATCNGKQTTDHRSKHDTIRGRQHATYIRQAATDNT